MSKLERVEDCWVTVPDDEPEIGPHENGLEPPPEAMEPGPLPLGKAMKFWRGGRRLRFVWMEDGEKS